MSTHARVLDLVWVAERLAPEAPEEFLDRLVSDLEAVANRTPADAEDPEASLAEEEIDALSAVGSLVTRMPERRASVETVLAANQMIATAHSVREVAGMLHKSESRVRQRLVERTLLGVHTVGGWRVPQFQFADGHELPGWSRVAPAFPPSAPLRAVERFVTTPHVDLELDDESVSPQEWLLGGGDADQVAALVASAFSLAV
ncbi:MAG: hypothetical protein QM714_08890 [Nocardioides sp.]|uniref:hypothetical protein n=1 Tax=Nocardioides sp. TaxID=35761 RepID=UPI0039E25794